MKTKDINNIIIGILSIVIFLAPLLIFPRVLVDDYNTPKVIVLYTCEIVLFLIFFIKIKEIKYDKKDIVALVFLLLAGMSLVFSINKRVSLFGEPGRDEGFFMILSYILVYYFAKYYFKEYEHFYKILFIIAIAISVLSILQFYDLVPFQKILGLQYKQYWTSGTFGNPNFLGSYITLILPIFMCLFILNGKKRFLVASSIAFWAMLSSLTRSAWVAFGVYSIIGIIYIIYKKEKGLFKNALILLLAFAIVFVGGNLLSNGRIVGKNNTMLNEIKSGMENGITGKMGSGRVEIWTVALNQIKMHPLFGTGIDTLKDGIIQDQNEYYVARVIQRGTYIDKAHNEYLQIAATMGLPTLITYLLFLLFIIKDNMRCMFKNKIVLILSLSIIGYLVQAFFNISTIGVAPLFWILLGLIQNKEFLEESEKNI